MANDEFLRLLKTVEALRRCEGKECLEVTMSNVEAAEATETARRAHQESAPSSGHSPLECPECSEIRRQENTLREVLLLQGVELPGGILETQALP